MATAKAIHVTSFAGKDYINHVKLVDVPVPKPGPGQVLVQPYLRPVNPTDILLISGAYGHNFPLPRVPGSEGVARVIENGPGSTKFQAGQRVVAVQWPQFSEGGSWTTAVALPEELLVPVPDGVSDETAAQFFINPVTVYGMLKEAAVPQGEWLLQAAASSVLGHQVIQYAKHLGIKTINVVRRSDAVQELKDAGADEVIATDKEDIVERVKEITGGKGAYAALDPVGGKQAAKLISALRQGGHYLVYGLLDPENAEFQAVDLLVNAKVLRGFIIYQWIERPDKQQVLAEVMKLLEDKVIVPLAGEKFPLERFKEALEKSTTVGRGAKVFIEG